MPVHAVVDLHCDTLTRGLAAPASLDSPGAVFRLSALPGETRWGQFCAIFLRDTYTREEAFRVYDTCVAAFRRQMEIFADRVRPCRGAADLARAWEEGKTAAFLSVENGSVLGGDLRRVETLRRDGVCALTLTWNGPNELASGHDTDRGLSDFGRAAVRELEEAGILADVSHLNDRSFWDVIACAHRPLVATHSNARSVCSHRRNLTDDMIRALVERDSLIGLNYSVNFLKDGGQVDSLAPLYLHIARFLDLGAGRCLALGSDFDGTDLPKDLDSPEKVVRARDWLVKRGLSEAETDAIFFGNAQRFFEANLP